MGAEGKCFWNIVTGKEHLAQRIRSIYNQHKTPYFGIYVFHQPNLVIRSPELIRKVMVKDFDKFKDRNAFSNESIDPLNFHSLFGAKDTTWRNLRSKLSPVFTSGKIKLMFPLMVDCANDLSAHLEKLNGKTVEMGNVLKRYSVDIISSCAFGINANCFKTENSEILVMATRLLDFRSLSRSLSMFCAFFLPKVMYIFRLTFADQTAAKFLVDVFKGALREREEKKIVRNDLIDLLNNLKKNESFDDSYKFDDIKMAAQAITFFSAGNDSSSITLSFAFYELALHKEVQDRLRREIRATLDKEKDLTYESIHNIKYLDMVLSEVLRKYPLTALINRQPSENYTFEETGFTLEKHITVIIPITGLHFDPEHFPDPEKFDPERFSDENKRNIKSYTYLPFGEGPRSCIGQRFALLMSKLAIAYVIKDYAVEPTNQTSIPMKYNPRYPFTQSKDGVHLRIVKV
ncbi:cytochrome P450 6k1-like isoform X2 [Tenebrio molitor]|uniref:cytochrome P450 6k1-like isoform X2 n=1 Tax=Tenebrio molitor TaxID=7067 RepID=UPI00362495DA